MMVECERLCRAMQSPQAVRMTECIKVEWQRWNEAICLQCFNIALMVGRCCAASHSAEGRTNKNSVVCNRGCTVFWCYSSIAVLKLQNACDAALFF